MNSIILTIKPKDKIRLPFAHMEMLQGLFYKLLSFNNEVSSIVHDRSDGSRALMKLFCFSDIKGRYSVKDGQLEYSDTVTWEIRSVYMKIISTIVENIYTRRSFSLNNCLFEIVDIALEGPDLQRESIDFQTSTPIVAYVTDENRRQVYFSPNDSEFYRIVEGNLRKKYKLFFGEEYTGEFELICLYCPDKFHVVTRCKSTIINAWKGKFTLAAEPPMLYLAYYAGIGSKNSMGFGVIDLE